MDVFESLNNAVMACGDVNGGTSQDFGTLEYDSSEFLMTKSVGGF